MTRPALPITILVADDDEEDRALTERAFGASRLKNDLRFVEDGEQLMDYLQRRGAYAAPGAAPRPGLLLLDIRMPRLSGFDCLRRIRADDALRQLPVVMLTTSRADEDIARSYELGVNSFIAKPVTFAGLVEAMETLGRYWLELVELPAPADDRPR